MNLAVRVLGLEPWVEQVLDGMLEGCQIVDRQLRYVYLNDAAVEQSQRRRQELLGRTMSEVYPGIEHTEMFERLSRCMTDGVSSAMLNRFKYPDGREGKFLLRMVPIPDGALVLSLDITERERAKEALLKSSDRSIRSERLEALGQLAGGVAHDFNNMLMVILGCAELAMEDLPPDSLAHEAITQIRAAADRSTALTRGLLAFSRRQTLSVSATDLNALLVETRSLLQRPLGVNTQLELMLGEDLPDVHVDAGRIEQAIVNLVLNARDAMPDGGVVTIQTEVVTFDEERAYAHGSAPGDYVAISVIDAGIGMDAATRARIFEPFFTTKGGTGTGLGLSSVYGTVQQSGGTIWVYSTPGRGTTFKIYLPVSDRPVVVAETFRRPTPSGGRRILLVDDERLVRDLVSTILEREGYETYVAASGPEARLLADARTFDLLITDITMHGEDGETLVRTLRQARPDLRVLYMSGNRGMMLDLEARDGQAPTRFLEKPFGKQELLDQVRGMLESE